MPRPLSIYKSVVEQDSYICCEKIKNLLGEIVEVSDKAHRYLAECIKLLTTKDMCSPMDMHTVDLAVRIWNDLHVCSELTKNGLYLQAMMMERDAIETMAIIEYLHSFPEEAEAWWKAKTRKERWHFSINTIKDKIKDGQEMKDAWDSLSSFIHPNSQATPAYGADKPYYGHNLFLSGFYYPGSVRSDFCIQLDLCIDLLERMRDWYKNELEFPDELSKEIDIIRNEYNTQADSLEKRTELEKKEVVDKVVSTRLSEDKIIEYFKSLNNLP
ncbi:hypothetical protein ACFLWC_00155 [Chloroflexota bacterium]